MHRRKCLQSNELGTVLCGIDRGLRWGSGTPTCSAEEQSPSLINSGGETKPGEAETLVLDTFQPAGRKKGAQTTANNLLDVLLCLLTSDLNKHLITDGHSALDRGVFVAGECTHRLLWRGSGKQFLFFLFFLCWDESSKTSMLAISTLGGERCRLRLIPLLQYRTMKFTFNTECVFVFIIITACCV